MQGGMLSGLPGGQQGGQQGGAQGLGGVGGRELQEQVAQMEEMEQLSRREEQGLQEQLPQVARASNSMVVVDKYKGEMSRWVGDTRGTFQLAYSAPCLPQDLQDMKSKLSEYKSQLKALP